LKDVFNIFLHRSYHKIQNIMAKKEKVKIVEKSKYVYFNKLLSFIFTQL